MGRHSAGARGQIDDEVRWSASDVLAMCLAMFDTIGPGFLVIAGIMVGLSLIVTLFVR